MLCHMVTPIVIIREIWMKENPLLVMFLHLPLGKVSFKMKLLNLMFEAKYRTMNEARREAN